jgi:exodeoxyribonuclease V
MDEHLAAFGKAMPVIGDPGQLPPIRGQSPFASQSSDAMLTEIHRRTAESPIIYLATLARRGERIPHGAFGSAVRKHSLDPGDMLEADQVICATHKSRRLLNNAMKEAAGFPNPLPAGQGQKIIGHKNNHKLGIFNGQFLDLTYVGRHNWLRFTADITTEDGDRLEEQDICRGYFDDHVELDKDRESRDFFSRRGLVEVAWGWAITCHKAQESGWLHVIVYDDHFGVWEPALRRRWLYTAITRAADMLTILD